MQNDNKQRIEHFQLVAILETAIDAIISIDSNGIIDIYNPAAEKLFGYSADEAIGQNVNMLMPEPYASEHDSYIKNHEETNVKKIIGVGRDVLGKHKNGKIFPIRLSVGKTKLDNKSIYVGVIHDIWKSKKQEHELKEHRNHLQSLVDQRTRELSLVNEKLRELANLDSLTNLPNRRYFDETLQKELQRAIRHKDYLSLLMCDIDFFKQYNDTYGHLVGDECLVKVAECLVDSFKRASDFPSRYGGEEFSVILPHTNESEAIKLSETFIKNLKELAINHSSSSISDHVTISIGIVAILPDKKSDTNLIIKLADEALYKAKKNGRNRIEIAILK